MGHYAAEMRPEWFEGYTEPKGDTSQDQHWIVDLEYNVVRAIDFQKSRGQFGYYERMMRPHYAKRFEAETAALLNCEAAVELARFNLKKLKHILIVQRPWESDK